MVARITGPSSDAEPFRKLAIQIEESVSLNPGRSYVLMVTSAEPGAGKTLVGLNLAQALAHGADRRVLLVESDIWWPQLSSFVDMPGKIPGLVQILEGDLTLAESIVNLRSLGFDALFSGGGGEVDDVLVSTRLAGVVAEMRASYQLVIFDAPPLMLAGGRALAARSDGVLLVVRAGRTRKQQIEEALTALGPDKVLGLVLNGVRPSRSSYHYGGRDRYPGGISRSS